MGKKKLELNYMVDEKRRKKTFTVRKKGLIKKLNEFTTLCHVKACAIIYDGSSETPEIWPANRNHVRELIGKYKARSNGRSGKTYGLSDLFNARKQKIEEELNTLRKKNDESKYPIPVESMNMSTEPELRKFAADLGRKIELVKSRMEELKKSKSDVVAADTDVNQFDWSMMNKQQPEFVPYDYNYSTAVDQMNVNENQFDWSLFALMNDYNFSSVDEQMNPPSMTMASLMNERISDQELCDAILLHGAVSNTPGTRPMACYAQPPELLPLASSFSFSGLANCNGMSC